MILDPSGGPKATKSAGSIKRWALFIGPCIGLLASILAANGVALGALDGPALHVAGIGAWMALWWMTEAMPLAATALLPLAAFPLLGIQPTKAVAANYMNPFIVLLMAGFMAALALERWDLHKRLALNMLLRVGVSPRRLILGVMITAALCSMWISNTATVLMMVPIATSLIARASERLGPDHPHVRSFGTALLLGLAYAASVGGIGTPIGTPPNLVYIAELQKADPDAAASFVDWMRLALPLVIVFVPLIWIYLVRFAFKVPETLELGSHELLNDDLKSLGPINIDAKRVAFVFGLMALLWITRSINIDGVRYGWAPLLGVGKLAHDATVAVVGVLVLFAWPAKTRPGQALLDWGTAVKIPWDIVLLFGGGVALAGAFKSSGLSAAIAIGLQGLSDLPAPVLTLCIALSVTFLTELTSNTATTIILMPVLAEMARVTGLPPMAVMLPAVLSASCAFMLPVATAPNAIVFGTGRISISEMAKTGLRINLVGAVLVTILVTFWA